MTTDTREIERTSVGVLIASAHGDLDAMARLLQSLDREELIAAVAYCARFAISYARRTAQDDALADGLRRYAAVLAVARP